MARHLGDDKMNSALTNLCWGTSKENGADAVRNGKVVRGERNGKARLTADNVVKILAMTGTHKEVASEFGVSLGCIYNIRSGRTWKHVARDGR
jgi:DNA invertase Pin-like site-specific DNA recombinase